MENQMNTSDIKIWKKIAIGIIAFIGFVTTIKLAIIYHNANFVENAPASFCSINEFIDCDQVAKTTESQFWGIPLAYWGMFFYFFIGLMMAAKKLSQYKYLRFLEVFKNPYTYISALGIISFVISMTLLFISLFQIKKICILCLFTYILNLAIALVAMDYSKWGFFKIFKQSFMDFLDAVKIKKYLIAFVSVMLVAVAFLIYTSVSYVFAPHVKNIKNLKKYMKLNDDMVNPYAVEGNNLGDPNATVKLTVYSDFRCPICTVYNIIIHKVVGELENVYVEHKNYPLDMDCNKYLLKPFHQGSCSLALYASAAEKQGNYWGTASEFYLRQPMTDYDVWMIAARHGLDLDKLREDVQSNELKDKLLKDIDDAAALGIKGTPAILVTGTDKPRIGVINEFELKDLLIKAGAKEKPHHGK